MMSGLPIIDIPEFKSVDQKYVLRAKDEKEMKQKLEDLRTIVPESVDVVTYPVGYKPDRPVPIARFFTIVRFRDHSPGVGKPYLWLTLAFQGSKKEKWTEEEK